MSGDALSQDPAELQRRIDSSKAHPARVYDVFLGGKDHYPADRDAAAAALAANPRGYLDVRHNRDFLRRAVTTLVEQEGIRQFLDIGTGLPTAETVHQIAQRITPARTTSTTPRSSAPSGSSTATSRRTPGSRSAAGCVAASGRASP